MKAWEKISLSGLNSEERTPPEKAQEETITLYQGKTRPSTTLYKMALSLGVRPFIDEATREVFVKVRMKDRPDVLRLSSGEFRAYLTKNHYNENEEAPSGSALEETLRLLEGDAYHHPPVECFLRLGRHGKKIFLDLADEVGRVVEIDGDGWRFSDDPSALFRRNHSMRGLPAPQKGGSFDLLRKYLNVADETSFILAVGFLLAAMKPGGPFPLLTISGEQGSGKSNAGVRLKQIIDPDVSMKRSLPKDEDALFSAAANHHLLHYDNISSLKGDFSDMLCRLSTGGGLSKRKLFSDADEFTLPAIRPVILNGIALSLDRPDLLSRAFNIRLKALPDNEILPESRLEAEFRKDHPLILGALLDAVSAAIRCGNPAPRSLPRMADAALWILRSEREGGLPWPEGAFLVALESDQRESEDEALFNNPVARQIIELMELQDGWSGTLKEFLNRLRQSEGEHTRFLPSNEKALSGAIERLRPLLRKRGIEVEKLRRQASGNALRIYRRAEKTEAPEPRAPSHFFDLFDSEGGDAR